MNEIQYLYSLLHIFKVYWVAGFQVRIFKIRLCGLIGTVAVLLWLFWGKKSTFIKNR